jgi:hypothetical protein
MFCTYVIMVLLDHTEELRDIDQRILTLGSIWGRVVSLTHWKFCPRTKISPISIEHKVK